jgi:hypothetical protein
MLPLGRRVQDKLEALIDKYMSKLGEFSPHFVIWFILTSFSRFKACVIIDLVPGALDPKWPPE